jgi:hypothetical protein
MKVWLAAGGSDDFHFNGELYHDMQLCEPDGFIFGRFESRNND